METSLPDREDPGELYDSAPCGLLSTLENGSIQRVNGTLCGWLGMSPVELVGHKRLQDLLTMGCKIFHQTHWMPLLQIQGSVSEVQLELVHRDGRSFPVLVNAVKRTRRGVAEHDIALFIASDRRKYERELLSARKRAEELLASDRAAQAALNSARVRLRLALDSAHLLVWEVDIATGERHYEAAVSRLVHALDDAPVSAELYLACIHPDDRERERAAFEDAFAPGGQGRYNVEYRLIGHDGRERVVSSSGRAIFDDLGKVAGFSGVLQDVTAWRRAERALREQEQQASARAILAEQLVGIVSHDLRTPLNAVTLGASMLSASELGATQMRTVTRIISAANRASRLIADLLDFTQGRLGGGLRVQRRGIDLHALVADSVEELKLAAPGRMIEHCRAGEGTRYADPDRLAQIVTNLATNALTYGAADRPITIRSAVADHALSIEVHNYGSPIPAELLPHIFEPLRRGEQQVKLGSRSVGLGLYIVQEIAIAHGGHVTVQSTRESGTSFLVTMPSSLDDGARDG
jgi:phosphoserine phosphatase RsbU/P